MPNWPHDFALSLLALAQHYGIATRLLDFTFNPLCAAYFAASGVSAFPKTKKYLAIWAIDTASFAVKGLLSILQKDAKHRDSAHRYELVTAPAASNDNLRAQEGVFLLDRRPVDRSLGIRSGPPELFNPEPLETTQSIPIVQVRLPWSQADELLRMLGAEGVDASKLFPGFRGIAESLLERRYFSSATVALGGHRPKKLRAKAKTHAP